MVKSFHTTSADRAKYSTCSIGNQTKCYIDGYWVKQDYFGSEGLAETIASRLASCCDDVEAVQYEPAWCWDESGNKYAGCSSKNAWGPGVICLTFAKLFSNARTTESAGWPAFLQQYSRLSTIQKIEFVLQQLRCCTGLNLTNYLSRILMLDSLMLNEDRHFNNLAVLWSAEKSFHEAPIFDNGFSLLGGLKFDSSTPLASFISEVPSKPFVSDFDKQVRCMLECGGSPLSIDIEMLREKMRVDSFEVYSAELVEQSLRVLKYTMEKGVRVSWKPKKQASSLTLHK